MRARGLLLGLLSLGTLGSVARSVCGQNRSSTAYEAAVAARRDTSLRIIVSIARRRLWTVVGVHDTLLAASVAVGSERSLAYGSQHWSFQTTPGIRTVLSKEENPVWIPPDWHYVEVARREGLKLVWLHGDTSIDLHDGSSLVMRGLAVRIEDDSTYEELDNGDEIVIGTRLFVPPIGSPNRRVPGELGPFRLLLGDGVGIHGTPDTASVGRAATHGCMRLRDEDITWLYEHIPVGTRVYIF